MLRVADPGGGVGDGVKDLLNAVGDAGRLCPPLARRGRLGGRVAEQHDVPMAQIAVAWVLRNPVVSAPIVGVTKRQHLADADAALDVTLSDDAKVLEEPYTPRQPTGY